jgi:DedD protein
MALLKFLRRSDSSADAAAPATSAAAQAVEAARQQARRRLLGAVVLLGVGIIGFPLVFQTQPRPIPVDIPIDIPRKDGVAPLEPRAEGPAKGRDTTAAADTAKPALPASASAPTAAQTVPSNGQSVEVEVLPATAAAKPEGTKVAASAEPAKPEAVKAEAAKAEAPKAAASKADAGKADSTATPDKDRGRFVVQAGSFTDLDAVRETRSKLERMGLKTYTQAAVIEGVTRVRVRVGPYATRQEAQDVQNKIKAAGLAATLLQL